MPRVSAETVKEFVKDVRFPVVARRDLALTFHAKHCRSGKIEARHPVKEARGVAVHAYGYDELGNVVALCADGYIRQFIR